MSSDPAQPTPRAIQRHPLRFTLRDVLAAMILFALQLTLMTRILNENIRYQTSVNPVLVAALFSGALTFGAAYLASRHTTTHKIDGFGLRVILLIVFDVILAASPLALFVTIVLWPLTLCFLFAWLMMRMNPARKKWAEQEEQRPRT